MPMTRRWQVVVAWIFFVNCWALRFQLLMFAGEAWIYRWFILAFHQTALKKDLRVLLCLKTVAILYHLHACDFDWTQHQTFFDKLYSCLQKFRFEQTWYKFLLVEIKDMKGILNFTLFSSFCMKEPSALRMGQHSTPPLPTQCPLARQWALDVRLSSWGHHRVPQLQARSTPKASW